MTQWTNQNYPANQMCRLKRYRKILTSYSLGWRAPCKCLVNDIDHISKLDRLTLLTASALTLILRVPSSPVHKQSVSNSSMTYEGKV